MVVSMQNLQDGAALMPQAAATNRRQPLQPSALSQLRKTKTGRIADQLTKLKSTMFPQISRAYTSSSKVAIPFYCRSPYHDAEHTGLAAACGHNVAEKAPCAASRSLACGVLNVKSVKHHERCDPCGSNDESIMDEHVTSKATTTKRVISRNNISPAKHGFSKTNRTSPIWAEPIERFTHGHDAKTVPTPIVSACTALVAWYAALLPLVSGSTVLYDSSKSRGPDQQATGSSTEKSKMLAKSSRMGIQGQQSPHRGDSVREAQWNTVSQPRRTSFTERTTRSFQTDVKNFTNGEGCDTLGLTDTSVYDGSTRSDSAYPGQETDRETPESEHESDTEDESYFSILATERRAMVERLMNYVKRMIHSTYSTPRSGQKEGLDVTMSSHNDRCQPAARVEALAAWEFVARQRGESTGNTAEISRTSASGQHATTPSSKSLGKRPERPVSDSPSDDENDNPLPKRSRKTMPLVCKNRRKFACPYFKRDVDKYISRRSCVGPGWDEVRRVKEHLYRNHTLPIFCSRCYEIFKLDTLLHDHQREHGPCPVRPKRLMEGFDKLQEKRLRSRKRTIPNLSEEDKWREMYRILFPDDDEAMLPSPYLEDDWKTVYSKSQPQPGDELALYEQFLRRELPTAVRRELEIAVEKELYPMEEQLKRQLVDIVRNLQLQLFQTYAQSRSVEATPFHNSQVPNNITEPETVVVPDLDESSQPTTATGTNEAHDITEGLSSNSDSLSSVTDSSLGVGANYELDAILFQFDDLEGFGGLECSVSGSTFTDDALMADFDDYLNCFDDLEHDFGEGPSGTY